MSYHISYDIFSENASNENMWFSTRIILLLDGTCLFWIDNITSFYSVTFIYLWYSEIRQQKVRLWKVQLHFMYRRVTRIHFNRVVKVLFPFRMLIMYNDMNFERRSPTGLHSQVIAKILKAAIALFTEIDMV